MSILPTPSNGEDFRSRRLLNRTFIGLLIAQFLASFNDQAIHASAMFFAINTQTLRESQAIALMPLLFYLPWTLFVTLAGFFADRYSKRNALVFWKFSEIVIGAIALYGFYHGTEGGQPATGAWIVLSTVFLMGTHAAFFGPAKYGVMPEILQPELLSRGNGLLESLSFTAVIFGTVSGGAMSYVFQRREWIIGIIVVALAVVGSAASLLIRWMPPANPRLPLPRYIFAPLWGHLKTVWRSQMLRFAFTGIAFFTFVVAFMRMTVYMLGESQNPRWDELKTSSVGGTVALGIGLGAPLAGWLSGKRIELGLVPLGAIGMVLGCSSASLFTGSLFGLIASTILIGFSTGLFLVPLFTLLQHSAPKESKAEIIATSNFVDVVGAILSSLVFAGILFAAKETQLVPQVEMVNEANRVALLAVEYEQGRPVFVEFRESSAAKTALGQAPGSPEKSNAVLHLEQGIRVGDIVSVERYRIGEVDHFAIHAAGTAPKAAFDFRGLPNWLFIASSFFALVMLLILWRIMPDLFTRTRLFLLQKNQGSLS